MDVEGDEYWRMAVEEIAEAAVNEQLADVLLRDEEAYKRVRGRRWGC